MAEGPEVHPVVGGPLGATHPPADTAVTRMAPPPWPEPGASPARRPGRADFELFVHGPSQRWHSSRKAIKNTRQKEEYMAEPTT